MEHEADHGESDHGLGDLGQLLVIFGQAPPPAELAESSLDQPAARQHDEALRAMDALDDGQRAVRRRPHGKLQERKPPETPPEPFRSARHGSQADLLKRGL